MLLNNLAELLAGEPKFKAFTFRDVNPIGKTKKLRLLYRPNEAMNILHQRLIRLIRERIAPKHDNHIRGALPGRSPYKNVEPHRQHRYFFLVDIQNAYPSVSGEKLSQILCFLCPELGGKEKEVLEFLQKYCLAENGGLVIGAPASPDLFNLYAYALIDLPLMELCKKWGVVFTRYLDDLTFSSPEQNGPIGRKKRKKIQQIIEQAGFALNHAKARVYDLKKGTIVITGVGLEFGGRVFLPRPYLRKIRGMLHRGMRGELDPAKVNGALSPFYAVFPEKINWPFLNQTERRAASEHRRFKMMARKMQAQRR